MMLKSLRVTADMDPSGFKRGVNDVAAANELLIESEKQRGAAMAQADAALQKLPPSLARLSKALVPGYTEASRFNAEMQSLARMADQSQDLTRVADLYERLTGKYNMLADAAALVTQNHVRLAPVVDQVNQRLIAQVEVAERAARAVAAASGASAYQAGINQNLGVRDNFDTESRRSDIEAYGAELNRLAAKFDPVEAAAQRYRAEIEELNRALKTGAISQQAFAVQVTSIGNSYEAAVAKAGGRSVDQSEFNRSLGIDRPASSAAQSADAFKREFEAIERVEKELQRRAKMAEERAAIIDDLSYRNIDQSNLDEILGVRAAPQRGSEASRSADVFIQEERAVARVNAEMDRRAKASSDVANEERRLRAEVDATAAAMQRYESAVAAAGDALSRHKDVGLYRQQVTALRNDLQNDGIRGATVPSINPDRLLGRQGSTTSARESAAVFEDLGRQTERMARASAELKMQIDPLAAAQERLDASLAEYRQLAAEGYISTTQLAAATQLANDKFARTQEYLRHVGTGVRLTQHEIANLSYQFNDIAVMLASGQAPFMLLMQQGMQIGQIIGPQGLGGGVKALGFGIMNFLSQPVNLAVIGFASLVGIAASFFSSSKDELPKVNTLLEKQTDLLSRVKEAYGDIVKVIPESSQVLRFELEINTDALREQAQRQLRNAVEGLLPYTDSVNEFGIAMREVDLKSPNLQFRDALEQAVREMDRGIFNSEKLREEITRISEANPHLNSTALAILALLKPMDDVLRKTKAIGEAFNLTFRQIETDGMAALEKWNSEAAAEARLLQRDFDLETREREAKTPAEKGAIAAERERLALLKEQVNPIVAAARVEIARRRAIAEANAEITREAEQAAEQIAEQNRQRLQAANADLASARLNVRLVGATPAEQEEQRRNLQNYLDLQRQANDNGTAFDTAQYQRLQAINALIAEQISLLSQANLQRDIDFEKRSALMPAGEADIVKRLRSAGIAEGTKAFEDFADQLRSIKTLENSFGAGVHRAFDRMIADANNFGEAAESVISTASSVMEDKWVEFAKTGKVTWSDMIDSMGEDLARLAYKLTTSRIFDFIGQLMGMGGGGLGAGGGGLLAGLSNFLTSGSIGLYANGAAFANNIVMRPTMFAYGAGNIGIAGEAGPEAIMPLRRGADGRLGVSAANQNSAGMSVVINDMRTASGSSPVETETGFSGGKRFLKVLIRDEVKSQIAGGQYDGPMAQSYGAKRQIVRR